MTATVPAISVVDVKALCADWSSARVQNLMGKHGFLTADQAADLRLMRWGDEARLLDDPAHVDRMLAGHDPLAVRVRPSPRRSAA